MDNKNIIEKISISKYRTQLMGFAMLWIMIYHIGIDVTFLNPITRSGYLGVDIFIFLSAYGLYHGFKKYSSIKIFYKKRILRILPTYYLVLLTISIIKCLYTNSFDYERFFQDASFIGFFFPNLKWSYFLWYIPGILFLYAIFPFIYNNIKRLENVKTLIVVFITLFIINFILTYEIFTNKLEKFSVLLLIPRIFVFIIGLITADLESKYSQKIFHNKAKWIFIFLLSLIVIFMSKMFLSYYQLRICMLETTPFIVGIPGIFIALIFLYEKLPTVIKRIVTFSGIYSLELYCVHESLYFLSYKLTFNTGISIYWSFTIFVCLSFLLAYILNRLVGIIISRYK